MVLDAASTIATYTDDTSNLKADSDITVIEGTMTRFTADNPIIIEADDGLVVPNLTTTERDAISTPLDGAVIFNSTDNELQNYHSSQWNGSVYGGMYQRDNAVVTTINTVDVWEDVLNFSTGEVKEASFASSVLTTGGITATYEINYFACVDDSTNRTYETAIEVDGVVRDESLSCTTIPTGARPDSMSGGFFLTIGVNKDIKLVIRNITDSSNVTVIHASVILTRIR